MHRADRSLTPAPAHDIAANFHAAYSWFQRADTTAAVESVAGMTCCYVPGGLTDFNVALPQPEHVFPEPSSEAFRERLQAAQAFFHARHTAFSCWTPQGALVAPAAHSLHVSARADYMSQHLDLSRSPSLPPLAPDPAGALFTVRRVASARELELFADLIAAGWSVAAEPYRRFFSAHAARLLQPDCPKQWYIGWADQAPACCMELFVQPETNVAGIYYVTTHNAFRRRGYALHLQAHVLKKARQAGCHAAVVVSEPGERRIMSRLGFADCGLWHEYIQD